MRVLYPEPHAKGEPTKGGGRKKNRIQNSGVRIQKDKAEARNQESE
jgi:hypothetical protein